MTTRMKMSRLSVGNGILRRASGSGSTLAGLAQEAPKQTLVTLPLGRVWVRLSRQTCARAW